MSIVGISVGYQNSYVTVGRAGGMECVLNDYSDRATPTCVSFGSEKREFGMSAKQQAPSNLANTISGTFKRLIGRKFLDLNHHPAQTVQPVQLNSESERFWFKSNQLVERPDGSIGVKVTHAGEPYTQSPEQLMGAMLGRLKQTAEAHMKTKVTDCVLTVPVYWTEPERRAMLHAAEVAGLNCLRLLNDPTAAALAYGIYKQDLPEQADPSRIVAFVDVGHSNVQCCIAAFNKAKLRVKNVAFDANLGGRDLDRALFEHLATEIGTRYKLDVHSSAKATARLLTECEKLKKLVSADTVDHELSIECFMEDKDVHAKVNRALFEKLCEPLFTRFENVLRQLFTESGLKPEELYAVELVGGGSRMPIIKTIIKKVFGIDPSTTMHADEALCRGAGWQCALISPTVKAREFSVRDITPYGISISFNPSGVLFEKAEPSQLKHLELFPKNHQTSTSKEITFVRTDPVTFEAKYTASGELLSRLTSGAIPPTQSGETGKLRAVFRLNPNGIFLLLSLSLQEERKVQVVEPTPEPPKAENAATPGQPQANGPSPGTPETPGATSASPTNSSSHVGDANSESSTQKSSGQAPDQASPVNSSTPAADANAPPAAAAAAAPTPAPAPAEPPKPKFVIQKHETDVPMASSHFFGETARSDLTHFVELEANFLNRDRAVKERADAKNLLEEYVYEMRDKIGSELEQFISEADREKVQSRLRDTEDWLYGEGESVSKEIYQGKHKELQGLCTPIYDRFREHEQRPSAVEDFAKAVNGLIKCFDAYKAGDEKYKHLEKDDVHKAEAKLAEKREWFNSMLNAQTRKKLYETPAVTVAQMAQARNEMESFCYSIFNKPKPAPPAPPPVPEPATNANASTNGNTGSEADGTASSSGAQKAQANGPAPNAGASAAPNQAHGQKQGEAPAPGAASPGSQKGQSGTAKTPSQSQSQAKTDPMDID